MLNQKFASVFIVIFISYAVFAYAFEREDWPFSPFGMYSQYLPDSPKCIYELQFWGRNKDRKKIRVWVGDIEYLESLLYRDLDCSQIFLTNGRGNSDQIHRLLDPTIEAIRQHEKGIAASVGLTVRVYHWRKWRFANWNLPDQVHTIFEVEIAND